MFAPSMLEKTNALLARLPVGLQSPVICFLTGSSGCGKTHLATALEARLNPEKAAVHFFDRIGVPSPEEMVATFGSGERWQETATHIWVERLAAIRDKALVVFEGQYHPKFAIDAITKCGLRDYKLAVVTADQAVWEQRLRGPRDQPFLVTDDMRNWANLLRDETVKRGGSIVDTSASNLEKNLQDIAALIDPMLAARIGG